MCVIEEILTVLPEISSAPITLHPDASRKFYAARELLKKVEWELERILVAQGNGDELGLTHPGHSFELRLSCSL